MTVFAALLCLPWGASAQPARRRNAGAAASAPMGVGVFLARATVDVLDGAAPRARGVVLARSGRILTALWPVQRARALRVRYPDGRVDRARVVATDPAWGVALLEGAAGRWPEGVELTSRGARTRDAVSWATSPRSVSSGVLQRRVSLVGGGAALLRDAWEIDPVPANGASGSGLASQSTGELVGLVVAPEREDSATGPEHAYGVPASVLTALIEGAGQSARPWLGVTFEEMPPGSNVHAAEGGLRVARVDPQGPGSRARLRTGEGADVVLSVDGRPVRSLAELAAALEGRHPGDVITLRVLRGGAVNEVALTLDAQPDR